MSSPREQLAQDVARELEQAATLGLPTVIELSITELGGDVARLVLTQVLRDYADVTRNRE